MPGAPEGLPGSTDFATTSANRARNDAECHAVLRLCVQTSSGVATATTVTTAIAHALSKTDPVSLADD